MAILGYIRVSDDEQNEALQHDALIAAGCEKIYCDHGLSGIVTNRDALEEVMAELQENDSLVVWKFDRLGRSTVHLLLLFDELRQRRINFISTTQGINTATFEGRIFFGQLALFAEYERELIRQRTKAGMEAARKRGKHIGRPNKLSTEDIERIFVMKLEKRLTHEEIASEFDVSVRTLSRVLRGGFVAL